MADIDWTQLGEAALQVGASIYAGQNLKKQQRQAIRMNSGQFPQLGMGLASTGPQVMPFNFGLPTYLGQPGGSEVAMPGVTAGGGSTAPTVSITARPMYTVVATPRGGQRVVGIRSMGSPLLWSGDLAAVRRVARVARKLGRFVHRRGHSRPR